MLEDGHGRRLTGEGRALSSYVCEWATTERGGETRDTRRETGGPARHVRRDRCGQRRRRQAEFDAGDERREHGHHGR